MPNPIFTLDANTLTFSKGINYPVQAPREQIQAIDRTAAGTLEVETLGAIIRRRTIAFSNLPAVDYIALKNWFDNISQGAANTFTYTDMESVDYTVRWINQFNFVETKAGYDGTIDLEEV